MNQRIPRSPTVVITGEDFLHIPAPANDAAPARSDPAPAEAAHRNTRLTATGLKAHKRRDPDRSH